MPVYHLRANALYMAIGEKMNHLIGKTQGAILKKTRVGGVISVGGGMYDWTTFGLSSAITFVSHTRVIADQVQLNHIGEPGSAVLERNQEQMARVRQLGRNVARAMQMPIKEVKFVGEHKPAACPICHCDLLQVEVDLPRVSCPVCWVHGDIVVENGSTRVRWDEESFKYARLSELDDHGAYIMKEKAIEIPALALEETIKILAKYKAYGTIIKPDKPAVKK
ncbi:MAG TPA: hypothetical protein VJ488_05830 [Dehalococcoidia bacterium]|nr:hypothetical protein [Dehalococcoidia bacterium]